MEKNLKNSIKWKFQKIKLGKNAVENIFHPKNMHNLIYNALIGFSLA